MSSFPTSPTVFTVDEGTSSEAAGLAEELWPHLLTAPPRTVLDLRTAGVLEDAAIDVLAAAHTYAQHRGLEFSLVNVAPQVHRALLAAGVPASAPGIVPEPA